MLTLASRTMLARRGHWRCVVLRMRQMDLGDWTTATRRTLTSTPLRLAGRLKAPAWTMSIGGLGYLASVFVSSGNVSRVAFVSSPKEQSAVGSELPRFKLEMHDDCTVLDATARLLSEQLSSLWESVMMTSRALRLFLTFVPLACLSPMCLVPGADRLWWSLLLCAIECSGPVFMKLGQWASTRRDLFSAEFCDRFARLQRSVKPHSWRVTCDRLDVAFGPTKWRRLLHFDENDATMPIGSGCVAQVYRAVLRTDLLHRDRDGASSDRSSEQQMFDDQRRPHDLMTNFVQGLEKVVLRLLSVVRDGHLRPSVDEYAQFQAKVGTVHTTYSERGDKDEWGETKLLPVAVKVLHPGIHTYFRRDLSIIWAVVDAVETLIPGLHWLSLSQCVNEFVIVMKKQIDLTIEARNLEEFCQNFNDVPSVRFPVPIRPLVTEHVLVETFEEGESILEFTRAATADASPISKRIRDRLADIGIETVFKMVFVDNFVHGDMHPGNMLVQNGAEDSSLPPRIVILDCGIAASLPGSDLYKILAVFNAIIQGNAEEVGELFLRHTREHKCQDTDGFKRDMANIVNDFQQSIQQSKGSVSNVIRQLFGTLIHYRVQLESNFAMVILSMIIIEGLGHSLKPDMDVLAKARPFVVSRLRRAAFDMDRW